MNILFSNRVLRARSGTEMFLWDLLRVLKRRGFGVGVFSPRTGVLSEALRAEGVPVWKQVQDIDWQPDILQCHHSLETLQLLQRFPGVPTAYVCHDGKIWFDDPPPPPCPIVKYVAVDDYCRERVVRGTGVAAEDVAVIQNGVDLEKFRRRERIPEWPKKALLFRTVAAGSDHEPVVRAVCRSLGMALDEVGGGGERTVTDPENVLPYYDLVFASARCALEAMACGCAVVVVGPEGLGPMVVPGRFAEMRRWNFGRGLLQPVFDEKVLTAEVKRYDPVQVAEVCERVRAECGLEKMADEFCGLYEQMAQKPAPSNMSAAWPGEYLARLCEHAAGEMIALERNFDNCKRELERQRNKKRRFANLWKKIRG